MRNTSKNGIIIIITINIYQTDILLLTVLLEKKIFGTVDIKICNTHKLL